VLTGQIDGDTIGREHHMGFGLRHSSEVTSALIASALMLVRPGPLAGRAVRIEAARQQAVFRAGVHAVRVDVSVSDGHVPVPGLTSADFSLSDNGVDQSVVAVAIEALPIDVTLLVDTSASTEGVITRFKTAVQRCADLLRPIDRVRLVTVSNRVDEVFPMQSPDQHLPVEAMQAGGGTAVNDAMIYAFAWDPGPDRRHLIVAFTDGEDNQSTSSPDTVVAVASRVDAVMHVVLADAYAPLQRAQLAAGQSQELASRSAIVDAAKRSGGDVHHVADAVAAFTEVFDDFRQSYTLYYSPQGVPPRGWHDILVAVRTPNDAHLTVRARKGYAGG
jgi:VWFA-related protein